MIDEIALKLKIQRSASTKRGNVLWGVFRNIAAILRDANTFEKYV
jgi:hypothetical protein